MSLGWREKLCPFGNLWRFVAGLAGWEKIQKHQQWQFPQQHLADNSAINKRLPDVLSTQGVFVQLKRPGVRMLEVGEISCHHMILVTTAKFYPKPGRFLALLLGLSSAEIVPLCFHKLPSVLN